MSEAINNISRHRYEMVVNDWMAYVTYALAGSEITLFGEGEERRDHVFIEDVAQLACRMILHKSCGSLNAATGELVDLVKAGIIDPAKVTRSALQNAASIAALLLTTEAIVADKPEPVAMGGGDGGMGGMGGMM